MAVSCANRPPTPPASGVGGRKGPAFSKLSPANLCIKLSFYCKVLSTKSFCPQKFERVRIWGVCGVMYVCVCVCALCICVRLPHVFLVSLVILANCFFACDALTLINIQFLISIKKYIYIYASANMNPEFSKKIL